MPKKRIQITHNNNNISLPWPGGEESQIMNKWEIQTDPEAEKYGMIINVAKVKRNCIAPRLRQSYQEV